MDTFGKWALALLGAIAVLGYTIVFTTLVNAQEPEPFRGIWCVSAERLERVVILGKDLGGAQEGIIAVNKEAEGSCFYGTILGVRKAAVGIVVDPDTGTLLDIMPWSITRVLVVADLEGNRFIPVNMEVEIVRYTLEGSKARGA